MRHSMKGLFPLSLPALRRGVPAAARLLGFPAAVRLPAVPAAVHVPAVAAAVLLLALPAAAQDGALVGTVLDEETGAPLPDAAVEVVGAAGEQARGVFTDQQGRFRIALPPASYSIVFSNLGYETERLDGVEIDAGETTEVTVELASRALQLNPIVVTASRREEKALDAPAAVSIVPREEIQRDVALTPVEHLKGVEGVDIARTGLHQSNVVARGFNNVFSGALLVLTDNRYAHVPSLRFNAHNMIPLTNMDLERIEVVLGPGAALYGPNAAGGVMHVITSSPIEEPGTTVSQGLGFRGDNSVDDDRGGVLHSAFRHASSYSDEFGFKVSGQWFQGDDWRFVDRAEQQALEQNPGHPRIANRLDEAERWGGEARFDWRPWDDGEVILNGGVNRMVSSVELTGIGAAQAKDWTYSYLQTRVRKDRFFAQAFLNTSDAGDTYLLRTGQDIVDESRMWVGQVQHGFDVGDRQSFTYGLDLQRTEPRTGGTITGANEEDDNIDELGGYVHSETSLTDRLDVVAALRVDYHSRLPDANVSPRGALVFRPRPEQNLRLTFNRAFSTPTTNNLFLDIVAGRIPVPPGDPLFFYDVRTIGVPEGGLTFSDACQGGFRNLCMYSPLQPGTQLPATAVPFWNPIIQGAAQAGLIPGPVAGMLLDPGSREGDPDLGSVLRRFNQQAQQTGEGDLFPVDTAGPSPIGPITSTITNTLELGYKGLVADRVMLSANAYRSAIQDFIGPLRVETPNVFFDPAATAAFVQKRLEPLLAGGQITPQQVQQIVQSLASVPVGTVAPDQREGSDLILTYRNFGDVTLWGADVGARLLATDRLSFDGTVSWVSDECFDFNDDGDCRSAVDISLNAPGLKGSVGARYDHKLWGLTLGGRARFTDGFGMNSGVYIGEVDSYAVFDVNATYRLSALPGAAVTLSVDNVFDDLHQEFVGAPELGRLTMLRLRYDF